MKIKITFKKAWQAQLFGTKLGWAGMLTVLWVIFGILTNWFEWAWIGFFIAGAFPLGLGLTMIAFACIINPIRRLLGHDID